LIVICFFSPVLGSNFEGIIHSKGTHLDFPIKGKIYIKGLKLRIDISGGKNKSSTVALFDVESQTMFLLYPSEKTVKGPIRQNESEIALGKKTPLIFENRKNGNHCRVKG